MVGGPIEASPLMRALRDLALRWKLLSAFALVLAVVVVLNLYVYQRTAEALAARQTVDHSHKVVSLTDDLLESLLNVETGYRGFMITGIDQFFEPATQGRRDYQQRLLDLRSETADNPEQLRRWDDLQRRADDWEASIVTPGLQLRRDVNLGRASFNDVVLFESSGRGKQQFDGMRGVIVEAITA